MQMTGNTAAILSRPVTDPVSIDRKSDKTRHLLMDEQHQSYTYLETDGDFKMRELDRGDLEQFNALLQYAFQVTSYDLFQTGWEQDEIKYAKRPILEEAYVIGWYEGSGRETLDVPSLQAESALLEGLLNLFFSPEEQVERERFLERVRNLGVVSKRDL
jgi:hypothetical protein